MHTTLIRPEQLVKLREEAADLAVFDCRFDLSAPESGHASYSERHVPGATYMHLDRDLSGPRTGSNGRHPLPGRAAFAALLRKRGVNLASQVVAYDAQGGIFAARLWWMVRWLGHVAVAVLDGGLQQAWQRQGLPTDIGVQLVRSEGDLQLHPSLVQTVDTADVLANPQTRARVVIDARSPDRYRGENETLDPRAGHIPGALNRFFKNNLNLDGGFKSAAELRAEFVGLLKGAPPKNAIQSAARVSRPATTSSRWKSPACPVRRSTPDRGANGAPSRAVRSPPGRRGVALRATLRNESDGVSQLPALNRKTRWAPLNAHSASE